MRRKYVWVFLFHNFMQGLYFCHAHMSVCTVSVVQPRSVQWISGRKIHAICVQTEKNLYQRAGSLIDGTPTDSGVFIHTSYYDSFVSTEFFFDFNLPQQ